MSTNEYFLVFESILYAAIVTQLIHGFAGLYRDKGSYKFSWTHLVFNLLVLLNIVQRYYSLRDFKHYEYVNSSIEFLIFVLVLPGFTVFQTYLLFPTKIRGLDFQELLIKSRYIILVNTLYATLIVVYMNLGNVSFDLSKFAYWVPQILMTIPMIIFALTKRLLALRVFLLIGIPLILYFMIFIQ